MEDTATVSFQVLQITSVRGRGRLLAFAAVAIEIGGVEIILQGVQVARGDAGQVECRSPVYRHADGRFVASVVLPSELSEAMAAEILSGAAREQDRENCVN